VLDTAKFSSIIYILYEGGSLSPPVVTLGLEISWAATFPRRNSMAKKAKGGKKKGGKKR
jgi:hypothetical protein